MSRRLMLALPLALALPLTLVAQAAAHPAMSGTWQIDRARSEPVPDVPQMIDPNARTALVPADQVRRGAVGGGSGRRGGSGGTPPTEVGAAAPATQPQRPGRGPGRYVAELFQQLRAPELMVLRVSADSAAIVVSDVEVSWVLDNLKHQQAQMDGTLLYNSARWKGDRLELIDGVENSTQLKREIKLIDDGAALELKLEISGPAVPSKVSRKVVYVRP